MKQSAWTSVIRPKKSLFDLDLVSLWHYRDLIYLFVKRDFTATYKQTVLGPLWFIIQPLISTLFFTLIFSMVARIPTDGLPPTLFYMTGLVAWNYFSNCLFGTSSIFTANAGIFGKVYFPRLTVPISVLISTLIKFGIQFVFLIAFMIYYYAIGLDIHLTWAVFLLPFLLVILAGISLGLGIFISALTTKYRDLSNLLGFGVQLMMYATPIIYPISFVPTKLKMFLLLNPISPIIEIFRFALLGHGIFNVWHLLYSIGFMVVVLFFSFLLFNKVEQTFMDTV